MRNIIPCVIADSNGHCNGDEPNFWLFALSAEGIFDIDASCTDFPRERYERRLYCDYLDRKNPNLYTVISREVWTVENVNHFSMTASLDIPVGFTI